MFNHPGFKKYATNTLWLISEKGIRLIFGLFVSVWVARYLGPEEFGYLNYALSYVFLFSAFSSLGLNEVIIKEIVRDDKSAGTILGTSIAIKSLSTFFIFYPLLILSLYIFKVEDQAKPIIFFFSLSVVFQIFYVFDLFLQSQVKSKVSVLIFSIALIISNILKIIFIYLKLPTIYFAFAMAMEFVLGSIGLSLYYILKNSFLNHFKFSKEIALKLIKVSWPLMLSSLLVSLYMKIDQVMIGNMINQKTVGEYAAALKFSEVWYSIPMILTASLFPAIINAKEKKGAFYYKRRIQALMSFLLWASILFALLMTFLSDFIVLSVYGVEFAKASEILKVHIWNGVFVSLGLVSGKWLIAENLTMLTLKRSLIGCFLNIILNLYFIPKLGGIGAAIATLISSSFSSLFSDLTNKKTFEIFKIKVGSLFLMGLWPSSEVIMNYIKDRLGLFFEKFPVRHGNTSYSQEGEDILLSRLLENEKNGFYVDVGSHHPKRFSNTYYFYKLGWRGINIDAMPGSMDIFNIMRPRDINIEVPISNSKEVLTYYKFNEPALNTFSKELATSRDEQYEKYFITSEDKLKPRRLEDVLDEYLPKNQSINFMTIDVEGLDYDVLTSLNFSKYKPRIILIEALENDYLKITESIAYKFLESEGYHILGKTLNTFFFKLNE